MIVALDAQLALGTATGIGEYVRGLERALAMSAVDVVPLAEPKLNPWRFDRRVLWDQVVLPAKARRSGADLLHCASGTMPLIRTLPTVVTVHDVAWLRVQQHARPYARWYFGAFSMRRYRSARAIAVDSYFSRGELLSLVDMPEERVHVVYPGVAPEFCALVPVRLPAPFVLVPGTVEPRKNLEVLVRALPHVPDVNVVSVGPATPYKAHCEAIACKLGVSDRLTFRGYVDRTELLDLYATCALVAVPSRYEGFGYAAAQAMCAGLPLLVSNTSSLPEVTDAAVPAIEPCDEHAWAREIDAIIRDPGDARRRAHERRAEASTRFAWQNAARAMTAVYRYAIG